MIFLKLDKSNIEFILFLKAFTVVQLFSLFYNKKSLSLNLYASNDNILSTTKKVLKDTNSIEIIIHRLFNRIGYLIFLRVGCEL